MGFPGTSGTPRIPTARKSVNFDGSTEYIQTTNNITQSTGDAWTVSVWFKPDTVTATQNLVILQNTSLASTNLIQLQLDTSSRMRVVCHDSGGTQIKDLVHTGGAGSIDVWTHGLATYDGSDTGDPLVFYLNGSTVSGSGTNNTGTMTTTSRRMTVAASTPGSGNFYNGGIGHIAIWNTVLDQNDVDEVFGQKFEFDPNRASGTYDKQGSIIHWYKLGETGGSTAAIGNDYVGSIDLDNTGNIADADIEADFPT